MVKIGRLLDHPTTAGTLDYGRAGIDLILDPVNAAGGVAGQPISIVEADAVGSIERVLGERVVRRALEDFDYSVPASPSSLRVRASAPAFQRESAGFFRGTLPFRSPRPRGHRTHRAEG